MTDVVRECSSGKIPGAFWKIRGPSETDESARRRPQTHTRGLTFPDSTAKLVPIIADIEDKSDYCLSTFARNVRVNDEKDPEYQSLFSSCFQGVIGGRN